MEKQSVADITVSSDIAVVTFNVASISDVGGITAASELIATFIGNNHPRAMVFDFEGVRFFSSQVLGLLLEARAKLRHHNAEIVVSAINPQLHRVFKITNLDKIFRFLPDRDAAITALSQGDPGQN